MRDRDHQPVSLDRYQDIIREILRCTVQAGRGIEVNTCLYHPAPAADYTEILTAFHELGGEVVTVGADAHNPGNVGHAIADGYQLLRACGIRYISHFVGTHPQFISLSRRFPSMRDLSCADITALVRDLCIQANCNLPDDVRCAI